MKTLMLGLGFVSGMTLAIAHGQEEQVSPPADRVQYSIESKVLYVQDELRPEYADSSAPGAFGSSWQGAWLAPSGKPVFVIEPESVTMPDGSSPDDVRFHWMNAREDVALLSAPRITIHGWRPGDTTFSGTNMLHKLVLANRGDASGGTVTVGGEGGGGFGGGQGSGNAGFSNVGELLFAEFPAPLDPRFFYGRGIIADIRTEFITYKLSQDASTEAPEPMTLYDGIVIAPRVVENETAGITVDYVLNYQSTENIPDDTLLTRNEIQNGTIRANVGMDLLFDDGGTQRVIVPLSNGHYLDVFVTVDKIAVTGTTSFDAH